MKRTPSPFYRDEEALRALISLCGQDLYERSLLRTGDERIARALSRRVILRLAEADRDTPLRCCRLLADAYLEQTLAEWELAMLQNSIRTGRIGQPVPAGIPSADRDGAGEDPAPRGRRRAGAVRAEASPESEEGADESPLAGETLFPRSRRKPRPQRREPEPLPPEEEDDDDESDPEPRAPVWLLVLLVCLCAGLLWFALGLFMRMGALPFIDLGYRFFNARVLPLF